MADGVLQKCFCNCQMRRAILQMENAIRQTADGILQKYLSSSQLDHGILQKFSGSRQTARHARQRNPSPRQTV
jgi:hypothetical protein